MNLLRLYFLVPILFNLYKKIFSFCLDMRPTDERFTNAMSLINTLEHFDFFTVSLTNLLQVGSRMIYPLQE